MSVVVPVERGVRFGVVAAEVARETAQGLDGKKGGFASGTMANLFTTDSILLVEEFQGCEGDSVEDILVIQRC